jgi:hypothetical protein
MNKKLILILAVLAVCASAARVRQSDLGDVVLSNDTDFVSLVTSNKFVLMDFFTQWW